MIFRGPEEGNSRRADQRYTTQPRPAFQVFLEVQKRTEWPAVLILQADHSRLAGEIAHSLQTQIFGDLPKDVVNAIAEHDFGWEGSDRDQIAKRGTLVPRPFPRLSPEESLGPWRASIRRAEEQSPLEGVIVSRHFCALATQDAAHRLFADEENLRRLQMERSLKLAPQDLDRWTRAIGFCDVLSLYLCSGTREPAEFALEHPALPQSHTAQKVVIDWVNGHPRFSSPLLREPARVSVVGKRPVGEALDLHSTRFAWDFVS